MKEKEWLKSDDPDRMLSTLNRAGMLSDRKLRLFAFACAYRLRPLLLSDEVRKALEVVGQYANGQVDGRKLFESRQACQAARIGVVSPLARAYAIMARLADSSTRTFLEGKPPFCEEVADLSGYAGCVRIWEMAFQAGLLRCVFGNPFRPLLPREATVLAWRDGLVVRMARAAYDERSLLTGALDRDRLLVLADALEEAGCTNEAILCHLRQKDAVHVRGCFALDWLRGMS